MCGGGGEDDFGGEPGNGSGRSPSSPTMPSRLRPACATGVASTLRPCTMVARPLKQKGGREPGKGALKNSGGELPGNGAQSVYRPSHTLTRTP